MGRNIIIEGQMRLVPIEGEPRLEKEELINPKPEASNPRQDVDAHALYGAWMTFLRHAAKYSSRYYLSMDLEETPHSPQSDMVLRQYYGGSVERLSYLLRKDLERLAEDLERICSLQGRAGLQAFPVEETYLTEIIMGFSRLDRKAPKRREWYLRRIRRELKKDEPEAMSLNQLEDAFQASKASR